MTHALGASSTYVSRNCCAFAQTKTPSELSFAPIVPLCLDVGTLDLCQLIYVSAAKRPQTDAELIGLLNVSRARNKAAGLSGLLLYDQGCFLQVLEGEPARVSAMFAKIARDERHHRISTLSDAHVDTRSFAAWSMGFSNATPDLIRDVPGFSDFFRSLANPAPAHASFALRLVDGFRQGRWHATGT
jgi:hypothetical protein